MSIVLSPSQSTVVVKCWGGRHCRCLTSGGRLLISANTCKTVSAQIIINSDHVFGFSSIYTVLWNIIYWWTSPTRAHISSCQYTLIRYIYIFKPSFLINTICGISINRPLQWTCEDLKISLTSLLYWLNCGSMRPVPRLQMFVTYSGRRDSQSSAFTQTTVYWYIQNNHQVQIETNNLTSAVEWRLFCKLLLKILY